jgi:hypothetical protein
LFLKSINNIDLKINVLLIGIILGTLKKGELNEKLFIKRFIDFINGFCCC